MKKLIFAFSLSFSFPSFATILSCTLNGERIDLNQKSILEGKSGTVSCTDQKGKLMREYDLQNGKEIGSYMFVDVKGHTHEFTKNASGKMDGEKKEYHPNGALAAEETYQNGRKVGLLKKFYDNGNPQLVLYSDPISRATFSVDYRKDGTVRKLICGKDSNTKEFSEICGWNGPREINFATRKVTYLDGYETKKVADAKPAPLMPKADPTDVVAVAAPVVTPIEAPVEVATPAAVEETKVEEAPVTEAPAEVKTVEAKPIPRDLGVLKRMEYYYETGAIASEGIYYSNGADKPIPAGQVKTYWNSGKPKSDCYFKVGRKHGDCLIYNENGHVIKKSVYENDELKKEFHFSAPSVAPTPAPKTN